MSPSPLAAARDVRVVAAVFGECAAAHTARDVRLHALARLQQQSRPTRRSLARPDEASTLARGRLPARSVGLGPFEPMRAAACDEVDALFAPRVPSGALGTWVAGWSQWS